VNIDNNRIREKVSSIERNSYSEDSKSQMVKYILEQSKSMPQIAEEVGTSAGVLHSWKAQYRDEIQFESLVTQKKRLIE